MTVSRVETSDGIDFSPQTLLIGSRPKAFGLLISSTCQVYYDLKFVHF